MVRMAIGGITVTVLVYVLLAYSNAARSELRTATSAYGGMAKAMRGE